LIYWKYPIDLLKVPLWDIDNAGSFYSAFMSL